MLEESSSAEQQAENQPLLSQQVASMTQHMQLQAAGFLHNQLSQLSAIAVYLAKEIDTFHQLEKAIVEQKVTPELVDSVMGQLQELRRQAQQNADAAMQAEKQAKGTMQ